MGISFKKKDVTPVSIVVIFLQGVMRTLTSLYVDVWQPSGSVLLLEKNIYKAET